MNIEELFKKYRANEITEEDITPEQYNSLIKLYDKKIRETKANNMNRKRAMIANVKENDGKAGRYVSRMLNRLTETDEGNFLTQFYLKPNGTGKGLDLYDGGEYLASYCSYMECLSDLSFHYEVEDFNMLMNMFALHGAVVNHPYKYRGVCSILFRPIDKVYRYVYYDDTLGGLLDKFEQHEKQALSNEKYFLFGVQGTGIHLFDWETMKYKMWIGGNDLYSVADVIRAAHEENKFIPSEIMDEMAELKKVDVFISHKSEDFIAAKPLYDYLMSKGISAFLSERSLPALSGADYSAEIDEALEHAKNIVVIASSKENVNSGWVKYEWSTFANEKRSGRKDGNIVTLIAEKMQPVDLPILLRQFEVIPLTEYEMVQQFIKI